MYIRWGDYVATKGVSYTLTPGIDPDIATVSIVPPASEDQFPGVEADLVVGDSHGGELTLHDMRMASKSLNYSVDENSASFEAYDRRWKWAWLEPIEGEYNRRDDEGYLLDTTQAPRKTIAELAVILLDAMGETDYVTEGAFPYGNPHVVWEYENPALALHNLCTRYGVLIVLRTDNTVKLWPQTDGDGPPTDVRMAYALGGEVVTAPQKLVFVGAVNVYQEDVEIHGVAFDPADGLWYGLDPTKPDYVAGKPSYKPADGKWYLGLEDSLTDNALQEAARYTLLRAYRLPATLTIGGISYDRADVMHRMDEHIVEKQTIDGEERYLDAYVTGFHATEAALTDPAAIVIGRVPVEFKINPENGILRFTEPVFAFGTGDELLPATLTLTCAFVMERYYRSWNYDPGVADLVGTVKREDVRYEYIDGVIQNQKDADDRAEDHMAEYMVQFGTPPVSPRSYVYAGIKDISPDGWKREVSWDAGDGGPTTTVRWGAWGGLVDDGAVRAAEIDTARLVAEDRNRQRSDIDERSYRLL